MKQKKSKNMEAKKQKDIQIGEKKPKSLDDFLATWSDEDEESMEESENLNDIPNGNSKHEQHEVKESSDASSHSASEDEGSGEENGQSKQQKNYLAGLKNKDPEFYKFLKENDEELLNFDESSSDDEPENEDKIHHLPDSLEVPSDESDFEADEDDLEQTKGSTKSLAINSK